MSADGSATSVWTWPFLPNPPPDPHDPSMHLRAGHPPAARMVDQRGRLLSPTNRTKRPRLDTDIHTPKKRKLNHPSVPPPQFWDNLSQPVLTRNALRELDRRNSIRDQSRNHTIRRRYNTRRASLAAHRSPTHTLLQLSPTGRVQLKLSARHGGPDLQDVRGVWIPSEYYGRLSLTFG